MIGLAIAKGSAETLDRRVVGARYFELQIGPLLLMFVIGWGRK